MFSFKSIVLIVAAFTICTEVSAAPSIAAPLIAPAAVGYAHAIPQNVPPFAAQFSAVNRAVSPLVAAPAVAAPLAYAAPVTAPFAARVAAPLAAPVAAALAAPVAGPYGAPVAGPYGAPVAAPLATPFAAPAPFAAPFAAAATLAAPVAPFGAAPFLPAAYTGFPYSAPLLRSPYLAPTFVR